MPDNLMKYRDWVKSPHNRRIAAESGRVVLFQNGWAQFSSHSLSRHKKPRLFGPGLQFKPGQLLISSRLPRQNADR
jgi:hypothetical protein